MGFSSARSSRPEALQELSLVMEPAGTSSRELFWRSLIGRFDVRLRAYLGRTGCSDDRVEEVLWDVWALAAEHEEELRLADEVCQRPRMDAPRSVGSVPPAKRSSITETFTRHARRDTRADVLSAPSASK